MGLAMRLVRATAFWAAFLAGAALLPPPVLAAFNATSTVSELASTPSANTTLQNAATANGNGTALVTTGYSWVLLTVNCASCATGATVNFEGTQDGTNFIGLSAVQLPAFMTPTETDLTSTAGITVWAASVAGYANIRARTSGLTGSNGTVTVTATAMPQSTPSPVFKLDPSNLLTIDNSATFAAGSTGGSAIECEYTSGGATAITSGKLGVLGCSAARALFTDPQDSGGGDMTNAVAHALKVEPVPGTASGWTTAVFAGSISGHAALTTTVEAVKTSAGELGYSYCYNPNTTSAVVEFFNAATGSVTLGTTVPNSFVELPPTSGQNAEIVMGIPFSTAISAAAVTAVGGSTAPSTGIDCTIGYN